MDNALPDHPDIPECCGEWMEFDFTTDIARCPICGRIEPVDLAPMDLDPPAEPPQVKPQ
jgi:hypothetical protein